MNRQIVAFMRTLNDKTKLLDLNQDDTMKCAKGNNLTSLNLQQSALRKNQNCF